VDTATIEIIFTIVKRVFPSFNYFWLVEEMKRNIPQELDFQHEAHNIRRCAAMHSDLPYVQVGRAWCVLGSLVLSGVVWCCLLGVGSIHASTLMQVPRVHDELSSKRILTMDFEEGCFVNDVDAIR
jgi:aarF domain-containing kinase